MTDPSCLLEALVRIPSPSRREAEASRFLADWMAARGFAAEVDAAGNAVGVRGEGAREILLLGHIDTVPGELPVRREGDRLWGRGTVDAKGPLCAFAAAAAAVEPGPGHRVTVVGAVQEEAATSLGARHILAARPAADGKAPRFCVIGEPSRWDRVTLGYKGRLLVDVDLRAPMHHAAGEDRLPAERGADVWRALQDFCAAKNGELGLETPFTRLDPSLRAIASEDEGAYGRVRLSMGLRLPPALRPDEVQAELEALLHGQAGDGADLGLVFHGQESACRASRRGPLAAAFLSAIRKAGGRSRFVVKTGTSDMNVVGPAWPDTPIVAYGPGDSALDHTPEEHIDLGELARSVDVLETVLGRLAT